jgi:putative ABC transport system permease protein
MIWFLHTELGLAVLATGDNARMITAQGVNTHHIIILGVGLSNAMVALSGALVAQNQGAADVNMGVGTIIAGLASVIVGETLFGRGGITRGCIAALWDPSSIAWPSPWRWASNGGRSPSRPVT